MIDKIINICNKEHRFFLDFPNVVGVSLSNKITRGINTNKQCIQVMVSKKFSSRTLDKTSLIPSTYKGIPIDVIETGKIKAHSFTDKIRPFKGGYSVGLYNQMSAGTGGCIVKKGNDFFILSNNHVLANENKTSLNTIIIQPSKFDLGKSSDKIASLSKFIPIKFITFEGTPTNIVDCAIAKVLDVDLISNEIAWSGYINGIAAPYLGLNVKKSGRTTGFTRGTILSTNATVIVDYSNNNQALFTNQIISSAMSSAGDSGSLLLDNNNNAVGLLFAGSDTITIYNDINFVLNALDVEFV